MCFEGGGFDLFDAFLKALDLRGKIKTILPRFTSNVRRCALMASPLVCRDGSETTVNNNHL